MNNERVIKVIVKLNSGRKYETTKENISINNNIVILTNPKILNYFDKKFETMPINKIKFRLSSVSIIRVD